MAKIVLVTGASAGIGRATALELLRAGHTVYGAARHAEAMADLVDAGGHALLMDVTSDADCQRVIGTVIAERGWIDALVNNAGYGLYGAAEDIPIDRARQQLEVNLLGPARLAQLVLPSMRKKRSGVIVNISSMAGEVTFPMGGWYHASKHALEAYSDALRMEVAPFGIHVVLVRPGVIKTGFGDEMKAEILEFSGSGPYASLANAMVEQTSELYSPSGRGSAPELVAKTVRKAIESPKPKTRYTVGYLAKPVIFLNRVIPDRVLDRLLARQIK